MNKKQLKEQDFDFNNFSKKEQKKKLSVLNKIFLFIIGFLIFLAFFTPEPYGDIDNSLECKISNSCKYYV